MKVRTGVCQTFVYAFVSAFVSAQVCVQFVQLDAMHAYSDL
jgi:hypothetical protein